MVDGGNIVIACIKGRNFDLLHHLVKDTRKNVNKGKSSDELSPAKYDLSTRYFSNSNMNYWWKSRECKDNQGNNALHYVFEIDEENIRMDFLRLCVEDEIGSVTKRNRQGLLPQEIEHVQPIKLSKDILERSEFMETR